MAVLEVLPRAAAALLLYDPASGSLPMLALAAFGVVAVCAAVLIARVMAIVLGLPLGGSASPRRPGEILVRIQWSHPDADGHTRSRAPGAVATT